MKLFEKQYMSFSKKRRFFILFAYSKLFSYSIEKNILLAD